ncbi:hypothetical protein GGR52DRAFT_536682 [Hypoxylon sp. FL1284]|nr:hypothetical protein GGR52DRAFT_536682 [Hypoxylon sp. FL1284]
MTTPSPSREPSPDEELRLPGFGLLIDCQPTPSLCFLHPLSYNRFESDGLKLREMRMMNFISLVTDKPNWEDKVLDDQILSSWLEEARLSYPLDLDEDVFFSERMYQVCVQELREKADFVKKTGIVHVLDAEIAVAKSDTIVSPALVSSLRTAVRALDVPDFAKDWDPWEGRILHILDPSLFPLIYGFTRVLPRGRIPLQNYGPSICTGETICAFNRHEVRRPAYWGATQMLPSDIEWADTGPRIASYVNNLHPEGHRDLYGVLEQFISAAIPLWEECLFYGPDRRAPRIVMCPSGNNDFSLMDGEEPEYQYHNQIGRFLDYEWWIQHRVIWWPEPGQYTTRIRDPEVKPNLRTDLCCRPRRTTSRRGAGTA